MRNKCEANHVLYRDGIYYYLRRVPHDLTSYYNVKRLCFSLKTKSASAAVRASKSINQRLDSHTQEETQVIARLIQEQSVKLFPNSWIALSEDT